MQRHLHRIKCFSSTCFSSNSIVLTSKVGVLLITLIIYLHFPSANLTWRDVQYLLAYTSNPSLHGEFQVNGKGLRVSHKHGFGALDVEAMVTRARRWINVPHQLSYSTGKRFFGCVRNESIFRIVLNVL